MEIVPRLWQQGWCLWRRNSQAECAGRQKQRIEGLPTTHRICGAADSDAHISALEGWRIIDAVACHANIVSELPQGLHNEKLVVGKHLRDDRASEPPDMAIQGKRDSIANFRRPMA